MSRRAYSCAVVCCAVVAYLLVFPDDLAFAERLLRLTEAIAPGVYAVLVAVVLVAGATRIWGRQSSATAISPIDRAANS
jgi:hypothetical protein